MVSALDESVIFNKERQEFDQLAPCPQEEADARLMVQIYDISRQGYEKAIERNVDTDAVVIALSNFNKPGKSLRYLSVHDIFFPLININLMLLPHSMHSPAATIHLHLQIKAKRQHGTRGTFMII